MNSHGVYPKLKPIYLAFQSHSPTASLLCHPTPSSESAKWVFQSSQWTAFYTSLGPSAPPWKTPGHHCHHLIFQNELNIQGKFPLPVSQNAGGPLILPLFRIHVFTGSNFLRLVPVLLSSISEWLHQVRGQVQLPTSQPRHGTGKCYISLFSPRVYLSLWIQGMFSKSWPISFFPSSSSIPWFPDSFLSFFSLTVTLSKQKMILQLERMAS